MIAITYADRQSRDSLLGGLPQAKDVSQPVSDIIAAVRAQGDQALYELTERFDGVKLDSLKVSQAEINEAVASLPEELLQVIRRAADNIRAFHQRQVRQGFLCQDRPGVTLGQKVLPLDSVGLYVPGGTASYPSSVLMNAVPAKIAGCPRIVMTTPPDRQGGVAAAILAAASIAGIDTIYNIGGAQAIAALAYGTASVPQVDKIVGPGNAYVAEAKRQVYGQVAIDMIAGPSEILIIADAASDPKHLAADLLSQAEHDALSAAILITPSEPLALLVQAEIERQLSLLPRQQIARASIEGRGRIIICRDLEEALALSNLIAPEHLELQMDEPFAWLDQVRHAGSVFLGRHCPEAMGDYLAGTNHTLPTGGTARFSSALSVDDFVKKIQFSYYTRQALLREGPDAARFARQEGLEAHARSVESRYDNFDEVTAS